MKILAPATFRATSGFKTQLGTAKIFDIRTQLPDLTGVDVSRPKNIAICGGLGDVTGRCLNPGFDRVRQQFPNVRFLVVDLPGAGESKTQTALQKLTFPWVQGIPNYFPAEKFYAAARAASENILRIDGQDVLVDAVIEATPPNTHLKTAELFAWKNIQVWVEKPTCMPDELNKMSLLAATNPGKIFAVDYFLASDAYTYLLGSNILYGIGDIQKIEGRLVERPTLLPERLWLLNPEISGGGLGMDVVVHLIAALNPLIEGLEAAKIKQAVLGRYISDERTPKNAETYLWLKAVTLKPNPIEIFLDGGTGLDTDYEGITFTGQNGQVEMFNGAADFPPYIRRSLSGTKPVFFRFPEGDTGYGRTFLNFLLMVYGSDLRDGFDLLTRLKATLNAVRVVDNAYEWCRQHKIKCTPHPLGEAPEVP